jgi:hypothetical protein
MPDQSLAMNEDIGTQLRPLRANSFAAFERIGTGTKHWKHIDPIEEMTRHARKAALFPNSNREGLGKHSR